MSDDRILDRVVPRQQKEWDIKGALNFMLGGAGSGLLVAAPFAAMLRADPRPFVALGLALVAGGLFSVWLKIGRPWRAFHVVRRPSTSWMTREALIAPFLFVAGALGVLTGAPLFVLIAALLGAIYAYAQGRILKANIGIAAWRRWSCVALIVITAVVEGVGIVAFSAPFWPSLAPLGFLLAALIVARYIAWTNYIADLRRTGAPKGTLEALDHFAPRFLILGHAAAGVFALIGAIGQYPAALALGGAFAAVAGALLKYTLVCRAAFTQGFALPRMPARGRSKPAPGLKPGWEPPQTN
ncbi:MAG: hypothetical protein QM651_13175 [Rhodoblastus sp.]